MPKITIDVRSAKTEEDPYGVEFDIAIDGAGGDEELALKMVTTIATMILTSTHPERVGVEYGGTLGA